MKEVSESLCPVCMDTHHKGLTKPPWSHALGLSTWLWWPSLCHPKVIHHPKQWFSLPSGSVIQYFWKVIHQLRKVNWPLDPKDDVMGWSFILFEKWSQNRPFSRSPFRTLEIRHSPLEILYFTFYGRSVFTKRSLLSREKPCIAPWFWQWSSFSVAFLLLPKSPKKPPMFPPQLRVPVFLQPWNDISMSWLLCIIPMNPPIGAPKLFVIGPLFEQ